MIQELNDIEELNSLHEFMDDDEVTEALTLIVKIIAKPDVPAQKAVPLILKVQALSAKFAMLATYYTTLEKGRAGTVPNTKKQVYYSLRESCDKLAEALKYLAKYN